MAQKKGRTIFLESKPNILGFGSIVGKKEHEGPLSEEFDYYTVDSFFGEKSFEKAESRLQKNAIQIALDKTGLTPQDIDKIFAGDLLNQCIGSSFGIRELGIPFIGLYGACSTMALSTGLAAVFADCGAVERAVAVTSSHFCSAERQYRFPLDYGSQRTPTAQWTATASGALIITKTKNKPYINSVTFGEIEDYGITDANNMGAAMAPAAAYVIKTFLEDTSMCPSDFDAIITGDLGTVGSKLLIELLMTEGINISAQHRDCGVMMFDIDGQDVHAGGSGCGCSASVLCGYFLPKIRTGELKNILFCATGALMSTTASQQGESIPSISHAVFISAESCINERGDEGANGVS